MDATWKRHGTETLTAWLAYKGNPTVVSFQIPLPWASDAELWKFPCCSPKTTAATDRRIIGKFRRYDAHVNPDSNVGWSNLHCCLQSHGNALQKPKILVNHPWSLTRTLLLKSGVVMKHILESSGASYAYVLNHLCRYVTQLNMTNYSANGFRYCGYHDDVIKWKYFPRVTGHLCGEFTGPRRIPHTKASDAKLWCFLWYAPE